MRLNTLPLPAESVPPNAMLPEEHKQCPWDQGPGATLQACFSLTIWAIPILHCFSWPMQLLTFWTSIFSFQMLLNEIYPRFQSRSNFYFSAEALTISDNLSQLPRTQGFCLTGFNQPQVNSTHRGYTGLQQLPLKWNRQTFLLVSISGTTQHNNYVHRLYMDPVLSGI